MIQIFNTNKVIITYNDKSDILLNSRIDTSKIFEAINEMATSTNLSFNNISHFSLSMYSIVKGILDISCFSFGNQIVLNLNTTKN